MAEHVDITYFARGGRPKVDLNLRLRPDGQASLFVGNSTSLPLARLNRVGTFGGPAPAAEVAALHAYLADHDLLARGGSHGQPTPDSPARYLAIAIDGRQAELELTGPSTDAEIDECELLLQRLALALTNQPTRAVEATLELRQAAGEVSATIVLRSIGSEPIAVLLVDPSRPEMTLRAHVALNGKLALPGGDGLPMPLVNTALEPDAVRALTQRGALPGGITELPPESVYRIDLPPLAAPQTELSVVATGALMFWLPDGQAHRLLTLLTPETPLR